MATFELKAPWIVIPPTVVPYGSREATRSMLSMRGYPIQRYREEQPTELVCKAVEKLIDSLEEHQQIVVMSNDPAFLCDVSVILPMVYAFSTNQPVYNVNFSVLEEFFRGQYEDDSMERKVYDITTSSLLVIESVVSANRAFLNYQGDFGKMLNARIKTKRYTMMTQFYYRTHPSDDELHHLLKSTVGSDAASKILESSKILDLSVRKSQNTITEVMVEE
jgi:hypothetical protein